MIHSVIRQLTLIIMDSSGQQAKSQAARKQQVPTKTLKQLAAQEGWSPIKRVRAQITALSIKKAMKRVLKEKEADTGDNIKQEEDFNAQLSKQINYEKVAAEYGDANSVTNGVFSVKSDLYVTVGSSGEGKVWSTASSDAIDFCSQLSSFKAEAKLCGLDINPRIGTIPASAPNIVTGTTNGELLVWTYAPQLQSQKCVKKEAHGDRINSVKFLETGSHFMVTSYDNSWSLWDGRLTPIFTQRGHERQIHASCVHPDQSLFATADLGGNAMVWDLRTGEGVYEISQKDSLLCCDFHPDGYQIAVGGKTNMVSVFDLRRKKELKRVPAHLKLISDLKYEQRGLFLASAGHDCSVRLWHGRDYGPLPCQGLKEQQKITSIDIKDGKLAATGIDRKWSMFVKRQGKASDMNDG